MLDPRKTRYLTPSQECVVAYLGTTNYFRTPYEIAKAIGVGQATVQKELGGLVRLGLVQKRKRTYGFEAGVNEYKGKASGPDRIRSQRSQDRLFELVGVEPLHKKLRRLLPLHRAKIAEQL